MAVTVSNLIMGPGVLYTGLFGATEPTTVTTTPATGWLDVGGTMDGVNLEVNQTYTGLMVDQLAMRGGSRLTDQEFSITTNMAEVTLANLRLALNQTSTGQTMELDSAITNTEPAYAALLFDGFAPSGKRRRVILRRALSTESVSLAYKKGDQTVLAVTWMAHYVSSSIKAIKIEDEA